MRQEPPVEGSFLRRWPCVGLGVEGCRMYLVGFGNIQLSGALPLPGDVYHG